MLHPRVESPSVVALIVILAIVAVAALLLVVLYNRFVRLRNRVDNAWAQIEVQLKRRWDLIPNLVETVKGYAAHERETFENVTQARAAAQQAQTPAESAQAEGFLSQALGRLFAVAEAYPELQADENFRQLQTEVAGTENRIAVSRQVYNDTVLTFNNAIQTFPGVVLAGPFGFTKREFFETDETQREAPRVDFGRDPATPAAPAAPPAPPAEPGTGGSRRHPARRPAPRPPPPHAARGARADRPQAGGGAGAPRAAAAAPPGARAGAQRGNENGPAGDDPGPQANKAKAPQTLNQPS